LYSKVDRKSRVRNNQIKKRPIRFNVAPAGGFLNQIAPPPPQNLFQHYRPTAVVGRKSTVPGGGISLDGARWIGCRPKYLLPVKVLSRLFRPLMLEMLVAAHDAGRLQFFGDHAHLADKAAFKAYLAPLHRTKWFVYCKRPFAGPEQVLAYLSRYTHRVAISNSRLIAADATGVTSGGRLPSGASI
jgi:Putative transposase